MLPILEEYFKNYPARKKVAEAMFQYGLSVKEGKIYLGEMEVPISVVARFSNVNRKIVYHTIDYIQGEYPLKSIFSRIMPCVSLHELAPMMGWEVLELRLPEGMFGCVLKDVLEVLAGDTCCIRQLTGSEYIGQQGIVRIIVEGSIPIPAIDKVRHMEEIEEITLKTSEKDKEKLICHHCKVEICNRRI